MDRRSIFRHFICWCSICREVPVCMACLETMRPVRISCLGRSRLIACPTGTCIPIHASIICHRAVCLSCRYLLVPALVVPIPAGILPGSRGIPTPSQVKILCCVPQICPRVLYLPPGWLPPRTSPFLKFPLMGYIHHLQSFHKLPLTSRYETYLSVRKPLTPSSPPLHRAGSSGRCITWYPSGNGPQTG